MASLSVVTSTLTGCSTASYLGKSLSDCEYIDEFMVNYRNRALAAKAWHCQKHRFNQCGHPCEFKEGFMAGFMAMADGGNPCVPKVAPQEYWGWKYQSPSGRNAVDAWFQGYPYGIAAAESGGINHWSQVATPYVTTSPVEGLQPYYGADSSDAAGPAIAAPVVGAGLAVEGEEGMIGATAEDVVAPAAAAPAEAIPNSGAAEPTILDSTSRPTGDADVGELLGEATPFGAPVAWSYGTQPTTPDLPSQGVTDAQLDDAFEIPQSDADKWIADLPEDQPAAASGPGISQSLTDQTTAADSEVVDEIA
ncbi:MAG: hypothetical protein AAF664_01810, partial [Planctomycetota bacterium]